MGLIKKWLESVSVDLGYEGEITDEVIAEAKRRLSGSRKGEKVASGTKTLRFQS